MSVIKQISVFNGSNWSTGDIGADASNIDISSAILGSSTNVQSALTTIGNKIGTTAIPSALGTTITGAINTLNTKLTNLSSLTKDLYSVDITNQAVGTGIAFALNIPSNFTNVLGIIAYAQPKTSYTSAFIIDYVLSNGNGRGHTVGTGSAQDFTINYWVIGYK